MVPSVLDTVAIPPNDTVRVRFEAPTAGTYLYLDPSTTRSTG
jgi:hypothetical protein